MFIYFPHYSDHQIAFQVLEYSVPDMLLIHPDPSLYCKAPAKESMEVLVCVYTWMEPREGWSFCQLHRLHPNYWINFWASIARQEVHRNAVKANTYLTHQGNRFLSSLADTGTQDTDATTWLCRKTLSSDMYLNNIKLTFRNRCHQHFFLSVIFD